MKRPVPFLVWRDKEANSRPTANRASHRAEGVCMHCQLSLFGAMVVHDTDCFVLFLINQQCYYTHDMFSCKELRAEDIGVVWLLVEM